MPYCKRELCILRILCILSRVQELIHHRYWKTAILSCRDIERAMHIKPRGSHLDLVKHQIEWPWSLTLTTILGQQHVHLVP
jgi:hypothetical protein